MKNPKNGVSALLNLGWVGLVIVLNVLNGWIGDLEMVPSIIVRGTLAIAAIVLMIYSIIYDSRLRKMEREKRKTDPILEKRAGMIDLLIWTSVILGLYLGTGLGIFFEIPYLDTTLTWIILLIFGTVDLVATLLFVRFLIKRKGSGKTESSKEQEQSI